MNNWHIRIEDCTEAQKARLQQVYGSNCTNWKLLCSTGASVFFSNEMLAELSKQITPDEAFERLGLDIVSTENEVIQYKQIIEHLKTQNEHASNAIGARKEELLNAEKLIKGLKEQLAEESEHAKNLEKQLKVVEKRNWELKEQLAKQPLDIDWSLMNKEVNYILQSRSQSNQLYSSGKPMGDSYIILATRPKPKYTPEQLEQYVENISHFCAWLIDNGEPIPEEQLQVLGENFLRYVHKKQGQ